MAQPKYEDESVGRMDYELAARALINHARDMQVSVVTPDGGRSWDIQLKNDGDYSSRHDAENVANYLRQLVARLAELEGQ
ncbi:hypothetical protein [Nocardia arthritidis]|uniref:Uncharacterized protein n=1 Tax=Nocardia arthritidis TaxID=228602 RepID=A0A6G9YHS0_9NOCA|nr:hypothetical protein [Nocardia arthritidis]QIS12748.1 hypothetical protein F5544_24465 [Nocardia arthritidis]